MGAAVPSVLLAIRGSLQNYSGSILSSGVSQPLLEGNLYWNYIFIQNPSTAIESLYINYNADASANDDSMELLPGQYLYFKTPGFITDQDINIFAATAGHKFVCFAN